MPSPETSRINLEKANAHYRPPRPCRSAEECYVIRHLVWQWFRHRGPKWSARTLARWTGVSHTFVLKLKREFTRDPAEMLRQERKWGFDVATFELLRETREITLRMAERGELRPLRNSRGRELLGIPQEVPIWATVAYAFACLKNI